MELNQKLLDSIKKDFKQIESDPKFRALINKVKLGNATHVESNQFAQLVGKYLSRAYSKNVDSSQLPMGRFDEQLCNDVIKPTLNDGGKIVNDYAVSVQSSINKNGGVNLKPVEGTLSADRVEGICTKLQSDQYENVKWLLNDDAYMRNIMESLVDTVVINNADMQYESGLSPKIVRVYHEGAKYCKWCAALAGTYDYQPDMDTTIFRRHRNCHCTVDYVVGRYRQNVHSKAWNVDTTNYQNQKETVAETIARQKMERQRWSSEDKKARENAILEIMKQNDISHQKASRILTKRIKEGAF